MECVLLLFMTPNYFILFYCIYCTVTSMELGTLGILVYAEHYN
jgi:hypothetical protein